MTLWAVNSLDPSFPVDVFDHFVKSEESLSAGEDLDGVDLKKVDFRGLALQKGRMIWLVGMQLSTSEILTGGCVTFHQDGRSSVEMHGVFVKEMRGSVAKSFCLSMMKDVFTRGPQKIWCRIPSLNKAALTFAVGALGFRREGLLTKAFLKNRKLHDVVVLGVTKDEFLKSCALREFSQDQRGDARLQ